MGGIDKLCNVKVSFDLKEEREEVNFEVMCSNSEKDSE